MTEPSLTTPSKLSIPQLAFGLYKVPVDESGVSIILEAIKVSISTILQCTSHDILLLVFVNVSTYVYLSTPQAGYRHFDTATYYGNEHILGEALKQSGIPRNEFFIVSKVWNDTQRENNVRKSVLQSIDALDYGDYIDLYLIHWPVPGRYVNTYKELELLHKEEKIKHIGISNFTPAEYEILMAEENNIKVLPAVNQFEVSPFMYRPCDVSYFQYWGILVSSSKSLHRGGECLNNKQLNEIASNHSLTPAQVMLRWGIQKGLIVVCKTSNTERMIENRSLFHFTLSEQEMEVLDGFTSAEDVKAREELEKERKLQM